MTSAVSRRSRLTKLRVTFSMPSQGAGALSCDSTSCSDAAPRHLAAGGPDQPRHPRPPPPRRGYRDRREVGSLAGRRLPHSLAAVGFPSSASCASAGRRQPRGSGWAACSPSPACYRAYGLGAQLLDELFGICLSKLSSTAVALQLARWRKSTGAAIEDLKGAIQRSPRSMRPTRMK